MRRDARGFALITVLWIVAALGVMVTLGLAGSEIRRAAGENRMLLRRSQWAGRACLAIVRARLHQRERVERVDATDLGRGSWCGAVAVDPAERVNPNLVDSVALVRVLGDVGQAAAVLDWIDVDDVARDAGAESRWYQAEGRPVPRNGPLVDPAELGLIRGMESIPTERLDLIFTTRGDGRIDPNRAPVEVLRALTSLPSGGATRVERVRGNGMRLDDAEEVVTAAGARIDAAAFRSLVTQTVFEDHDRVVRIVAGASAGNRVVTSTFTVTFRTLPQESVIRIEVGR